MRTYSTSLRAGIPALVTVLMFASCGVEIPEVPNNQGHSGSLPSYRGIPDFCMMEQRIAGSPERCLTCRQPTFERSECFNVAGDFSTQEGCNFDSTSLFCDGGAGATIRFALNEIRFDSIAVHCSTPAAICEVPSNFTLYQSSFAALSTDLNINCSQSLTGTTTTEVRSHFDYFTEHITTSASNSSSGISTLLQTFSGGWRKPSDPGEVITTILPGRYKICIISRDALTLPSNFVNVGNKILEPGEVYCEGVFTMDGLADNLRNGCRTY